MISAVVLAAGTSSRLKGTPKQLLDLDGKPVTQHVVDLALRCFDHVVVVLGYEAATIGEALDLSGGARSVVNRRYAEGQSTSLQAGLAAVPPEADGVAVLLGDQPRLDPQHVGRVIEAFRASGKPIARPRYRGVPGHPVILHRSVFDAAAAVKGDDGLRDILAYRDVAEVEIDEEVPIDVDTWEAYERLTAASSE